MWLDGDDAGETRVLNQEIGEHRLERTIEIKVRLENSGLCQQLLGSL